MDPSTLVTSLIASLSLAVSIFVLWRQHQATGRAHFTAEWEGRNALIYRNHGPGAAKDVEVDLSGGHPLGGTGRVQYIGAFQVMRINVIRSLGEAPPRCLSLDWSDNRRGRQHADLDLPEPPQSPMPRPQSRNALESSVRDIARNELEDQLNWRARQGWR